MTMRRGSDLWPLPPHRLTSSHSRKRIRDPDDTEFTPISKKLNNLCLEEEASGRNGDSADLRPVTPSYQPSLPMDQNPVYYEVNRILFEAHQMRRTRGRGTD